MRISSLSVITLLAVGCREDATLPVRAWMRISCAYCLRVFHPSCLLWSSVNPLSAGRLSIPGD